MRTLPVTLTLLIASLGALEAEMPVRATGAPVGLDEQTRSIRELLANPPEVDLSDLKTGLSERTDRPAIVLMRLADDPLNLARVRILSIALLSEYPSPQVKTYLLSLVSDESAHPTFRGWALQSYARGFAESEPEEVRTVVRPYLSDLEPGLRARAEMSMEYTLASRSPDAHDPMKRMIVLLMQD